MLTVDELIAICAHYGIDVDPLLNESPSFSSLVLDNGAEAENRTKLLLRQLRKWAATPDTQVLIDQPGPFVHAFLKPEIVSFILFFEKARSNPDLKFDLQEARADSHIVSLSSRINGAYRSLRRIELWRPNMYDTILTRIRLCADGNRFSCKSDPLDLCNALLESLPLLKERFESRLDKKNNGVKVHIAGHGLSTDAICVRSRERYSLYRGRWYGEWTLTYSEGISQKSYLSMRRAIFENHQRTVGKSDLLAKSFFTGLERKIQQTSRNIEAHVLNSA